MNNIKSLFSAITVIFSCSAYAASPFPIPNVQITGGTITGLSSPIPIASGGTGANNQADALTAILGSSVIPAANGGTGITSSTGTGSLVLQTSPTLITPNIGAATATSLATTGNVNVQGTLSSTANMQPAGPTNSGISLGGSTNYAIAGFYDQTQTVNNRTQQILAINGGLTFRVANDSSSAATSWLTVIGGQASGISSISSTSGSGSWSHTGQFSATGPIISSGSVPASYPPIATNSYFYGQGQNGNAGFGVTDNTQLADARNIGFGFTGGYFNGQFVKDDYSASTKWLQVQGSFSAGATAVSLKAGPTGAGSITLTTTGVAITGTASSPVTINGFPAASALSSTTTSIGGSALLAGACSSGTVTITGAAAGQVVHVTPNTYPGDGAWWEGYVSSTNTVTVKVCVAIATTPVAGTYNVRVIQ